MEPRGGACEQAREIGEAMIGRIKMRTVPTLIITSLVCVGCATIGTDGTSQLALNQEPSVDAAEEPQQEKQSLDALLDEHERVTLVDDDTGDTKLVCRRLKPRTGTRLGARKLCATEKQWREREVLAKEQIDEAQRNMDAKCRACL